MMLKKVRYQLQIFECLILMGLLDRTSITPFSYACAGLAMVQYKPLFLQYIVAFLSWPHCPSADDHQD